MSDTPKKSKLPLLALVLSVLALFLSIQERYSTENAAITTINRMITDKVIPEMKRSGSNDTIRMIYDLKHVSIVLDQIKETSESAEVKSIIDQIQLQIETLSVKLFVNE